MNKSTVNRFLPLRLWTVGVVWLERCWPHWWSAATLLLGFVLAAWLDVATLLPQGVLLGGMVAWGCILVHAIAKAIQQHPTITTDMIWRRVEQASSLAHRPFDTIRATPINRPLDSLQQQIWRKHLNKARHQLWSVRWPWPKIALADQDPLALRFAFLFLLPFAAVLAWGAHGERLLTMFNPFMGMPKTLEPVRYEVWAAPPAYTKQAPRILVSSDKPVSGALTIPQDTKLTIHISHARGLVMLQAGEGWQPMSAGDQQSYAAETVAQHSGHLVFRQGWEQVASWPLRVTPDHPPEVILAAPATPPSTGLVNFQVHAHDDYGITEARLRIAPRAPGLNLPDEQLSMAVTLYANETNTASGTLPVDFSRHPLAGSPVTIQLEIQDARGQKAISDEISLTLPPRRFDNPIAKSLVMQRDLLLKNPKENRQPVARTLLQLWNTPNSYGHDGLIAMALRSGAMRLLLDRKNARITEVSWLIWQTALRIEDGMAGATLFIAQTALQDLQAAIQAGVRGAELAQRVAQAQMALMNYLQALARKMQQTAQGQDLQKLMQHGAQALQAQDLMRMLEQLQELAATGNEELVNKFLEQLQQMMMQMIAGPPELTAEQKAMMEKIKAVQTVLLAQETLVDDLSLLSTAEQQTAALLRPQSDAQQQIRTKLSLMIFELQKLVDAAKAKATEQTKQPALTTDGGQNILPTVPEIPATLPIAEDAMVVAVNRLHEADYTDGLAAATAARDALRETMQALVTALQVQMVSLPYRQQDREGSDPLGRAQQGHGNNEGIKLPDKLQMEKARAILQQIRQKSSNPASAPEEQDYLRRLLESF